LLNFIHMVYWQR